MESAHLAGRGQFLRGGARPPTQEVVAFIDAHRDRTTGGRRWGVEPICEQLQVAPSTYYDTKARPPSARAVRDAELGPHGPHLGAADHAGVASAVNNDVARTGGLLAVAVLPPVAAGITGASYLHPSAFLAGFRTAVAVAGLVAAAGGLLSAALIRNPPRLPSGPGTAPLAATYCALEAPLLAAALAGTTPPPGGARMRA